MKMDIEAGKKAAAEKRKREERLADKRRRGAPKREEKAKLKWALKVAADKLEILENKNIAKKSIAVFNKRKAFIKHFKPEKR